MYKKDLALNNLQWLICHKTKPNPIYLIYMYKKDLALNNLQWLIYHKIKPNQAKNSLVNKILLQKILNTNIYSYMVLSISIKSK